MSSLNSSEKQRLARKQMLMRVAARASASSSNKPSTHTNNPNKPSLLLPKRTTSPKDVPRMAQPARSPSPTNKPSTYPRVKPFPESPRSASPTNKLSTSFPLPAMSPSQEMRVKLLPCIAEYRAKEWISTEEEAEMCQLLSSPKFGDATNQAALQVSKSLDQARERHAPKVTSVTSQSLEQTKKRHEEKQFKATIVSTKEDSKPPPVSSRSRSLFSKSTKAPAGLTLERKLSFRRKSRLKSSPEKETSDAKEEVNDDTSIDSRDLSVIQTLFGGKNSEKGESAKEEGTREYQRAKEMTTANRSKSEVSRKQKTSPPGDGRIESEGESIDEKTHVDKPKEGGEVKEEKRTSSVDRIQSMFKKDGWTNPNEETKTTPVESKSDRLAKMRSRLSKSKSANKLGSMQQGKTDASRLRTKPSKDKSEIVHLPKENVGTLSLVSDDTKRVTNERLTAPEEKTETSSFVTQHAKSKSEVVEWPQENDNTSSLASKENMSVSRLAKVQLEKIEPSCLIANYTGNTSEVVEWPHENDDTSSLATKEGEVKIEMSRLFKKHGGSKSVNCPASTQNGDNSTLATEGSKSVSSRLVRGQKERVDTSRSFAMHARSKTVNGAGSMQKDDNVSAASQDSRSVSGQAKLQRAKSEMSILASKLAKKKKAVTLHQENAPPSKTYVQQPLRSVLQETAIKDGLNDSTQGEEQQIFEPRAMSIGSQEEIKDLFVEMAFFARLGFVQPPSCLQCVYHEGIDKGSPDLHCKRFVPWRKNANTPIHPYLLDDNIVLVHCQAARSLIQGQEVDHYQWDKVRRQLVTK